jgi:uncharacterized BrkB/YihY/UPF0761 family membrane protein
MIAMRPLQKPSWRTGIVKRIYRVSPKDRRDFILVVFLFLFQAVLMVVGIIYAS